MTQELKNILYVEDEPDIQAVARLALEAVGGFSVTICSSGAEAVKLAPELRPDLILLDVMMPGMDGVNTLRALRDIPETAATPVIFMTAKAQQSEIRDFRELGALDVIAKPFDPMALSDQVRRIYQAANGG